MGNAAEKIEMFPIPQGEWIRPVLLFPTFGITAEAARKYRERGVWLEGKHWRFDPLGKVVYSPTAINDWFGGKV